MVNPIRHQDAVSRLAQPVLIYSHSGPFIATWAKSLVEYCSTVLMTVVLRTRFPVASFFRLRYSHRSGPALHFVHLKQPRCYRCCMLEASSCKLLEVVFTKTSSCLGWLKLQGRAVQAAGATIGPFQRVPEARHDLVGERRM
jgi:hypothetical protein